MSDQPIDSPNSTTSSESPAETTQTAQSSSRRKWLIENLISLGLALFLVFMIRSSVIEAFKIPSGSMIPTLLIGDHIFVNKFAYGFKLPFSDLFSKSPFYLIERDPPKRGDVIVFIYPKDESFYYIKRVVGVPGDSVEIRNKILYLNRKPVTREALPKDSSDRIFGALGEPRYSPANLELFSERMNENDHLIMVDKNNFLGESFGPITVPPESLFVMGDNRDFSNDSRFWGFVPFRNVKGKAIVVWLSATANPMEGQFTFRPERIGNLIH